MTDTLMRVLTLRPPWGEAITLGDDTTGKRIENRTVGTRYRGLVAIHSGRRPDWDAPPRAWEAAGLNPPWTLGITQKKWIEMFVTGTIISVAELTGCHPGYECCGDCSPWAINDPGAWHWGLANVRRLPDPVPWTGVLGLLPLDARTDQAVRAQLADMGAHRV